MHKPEFKFKMSRLSAKHNWEILQKYQGNLGRALQAHKNTPLGCGSEFREVEALRPLLQKTPLWDRFSNMLSSGVEFPLEDLNPQLKQQDLIEGIEFGNHKGVQNNEQLFLSMMKEEVEHGFQLVIPIEKVPELEGGLVAPMNIIKQNATSELGEIVEKDRLTHNQSKVFGSGTSVNSRVKKEELQDCMFGF